MVRYLLSVRRGLDLDGRNHGSRLTEKGSCGPCISCSPARTVLIHLWSAGAQLGAMMMNLIANK